VIRVYDLAVDTPDVGVEATAEARGSPLSPKGFGAQGDVSVRGFDALAGLVDAAPPAVYLPLLRDLGTPAKADDGSPRLKFHLAVTLQKWLTVNGVDVDAWFGRNGPAPGQPRVLRPAVPPLSGADVGAVQHALAAAKIETPQNGTYDGATAAAVSRFQKANALNADGVVDVATRQKLGVKPEPPHPSGAAKGAN
jgi:peptidoglycan hydrolase-like protein with peptidoglycan-binding domain